MREQKMMIQGTESNTFISFELIDKETSYLPSISFDININDFLSKLNQVWFAEKKIELFVNELKSLFNTDRKTSSLETMSPNEFVLMIEKIDNLGHYALKYEITKNSYIQDKLVKQEIKNIFEITQCEVDKIIDYFNSVLIKE